MGKFRLHTGTWHRLVAISFWMDIYKYITPWQIEGETVEVGTDIHFLASKITADRDCSREIRRQLLLGRKSDDKPRQCVEKQRHHSADKGPYSQGCGLPSGQVWL